MCATVCMGCTCIIYIPPPAQDGGCSDSPWSPSIAGDKGIMPRFLQCSPKARVAWRRRPTAYFTGITRFFTSRRHRARGAAKKWKNNAWEWPRGICVGKVALVWHIMPHLIALSSLCPHRRVDVYGCPVMLWLLRLACREDDVVRVHGPIVGNTSHYMWPIYRYLRWTRDIYATVNSYEN